MALLQMIINQCDTDLALYNLCNYITDFEKTRGFIGGRGLRPAFAYEDMKEGQELWNKAFGRRAHHIVLCFSDAECITADEAKEIGMEVAAWFFPGWPVLFGVHTQQAHLHIHFAISSVNLETGRKLHLDFGDMCSLQVRVYKLMQQRYLT